MAMRKFGIGLLCGVCAIAAASPAWAADEEPAGGDIIVRAQRVAQRLQDVPVAVTPVGAKELENKRLHDLPQLTLAVPALEVTTDNAFTLRGIGSQIFSANVDSSVGVMVDDISLGVPVFMSNAAFVDVDQVEVLTGPQGLLFGRNASAGLMNIITKRPVIGKTGGEFNLEYDNRDAPGGHFGMVGTGVLNIPTGSNSALRINVLESVQDPIAKVVVSTSPNLQDKQVRTMGKLKWLWEPTDATSVYFIGDFSRERGVGGIWDDTWRTTGAGGNDSSFAAADGITPGPENLYKAINGADFRSVDTGGASLNVSHELGGGMTLSNIFGWRHYTLNYNVDSDNSAQQGLDVNGGHQVYNQFSDELRLAFKGSRIDGQVGAFAFWSVNDATAQFKGANGFSFLGIDNFLYGTNAYHLTGRSLAAYGQLNFHATDKLQLIAGARVTNDHVAVRAMADNYTPTPYTWPSYLGFLNYVFPQLPAVNLFGPLNQNYAASGDNTNFSYKLGAQYNFTPDAMAYVTWSTGYKGPAMQTNLAYVGQSPYLKPETVKSIEAGIKTQLFDRRLRLNVSAYIEKFTNFQAQSFTATGTSIIGNAEGVKASGVEINASLKAGHGFTINYNANFQDSHFTDYSTDPCYIGQTTNGCSSTQAFFQGAGVKTSTAANYRGTLEGVYEVALGEDTLELSANWYHRSSINFTTAGAPYAQLGAINVFGANVSYRMANGISLAVFCKNCTNKVYPNYIGSDPGDSNLGVLSTINRWGYNSVRTIGASLGVKF